jgi:hypothetical protein
MHFCFTRDEARRIAAITPSCQAPLTAGNHGAMRAIWRPFGLGISGQHVAQAAFCASDRALRGALNVPSENHFVGREPKSDNYLDIWADMVRRGAPLALKSMRRRASKKAPLPPLRDARRSVAFFLRGIWRGRAGCLLSSSYGCYKYGPP